MSWVNFELFPPRHISRLNVHAPIRASQLNVQNRVNPDSHRVIMENRNGIIDVSVKAGSDLARLVINFHSDLSRPFLSPSCPNG